jgi:hypothetical protein
MGNITVIKKKYIPGNLFVVQQGSYMVGKGNIRGDN